MPRWLRVALVLGGAWTLSVGTSERVRVPEASAPSTSLRDVVRVHVGVPSVPSHAWGAEAAGAVLALVERALAELPGVVPEVEGVAPMPGLALAPAGVPWRLSLDLAATDASVEVVGTLCDVTEACFVVHADGDRLAPHAAIAGLVRQVARRLAVAEGPGVDTISRPETADPYAALLLGRSAALTLGLLGALPPDALGDPKRDPVVRAVFLDPGMVTAQALVVRSDRSPEARRAAALLAVQADGTSAVRLADLAALLDALDPGTRSVERWRDVGRRAPTDVRFLLPRARAELAAGDADAARRLLDRLPTSAAEDPAVLATRAAVAERSGTQDDALLARWQEAAPADPEPVRRRVALAVAHGDLVGAMTLTDTLATRGVEEEAARLRLALASELGRFDEAVAAAGALGAKDLARQLQAASAAADPRARLDALGGMGTPEARLARGEALLALGRAPAAVDEAQRVLVDDPWRPDALDLLARALEARGVDAAEVRQRLASADPWYGREVP